MLQDFVTSYKDQSRDMLAAILDQSQDCIKLVTLDGSLEYMNPNGRRAMRIADFGDVAQAPWASLWPRESRTLVENSIAAARRGERSRFEAYCPTATGEPRWWDVSVAPVRDSRGTITHVLATSRDVTATMNERLSDRLRRVRAEETASHSEAVAHEMRHRLKNQLAVVASVARLIGRSVTDVSAFRAKLDEKLAALARAHEVNIASADGTTPARNAIERVLDASGAGDHLTVCDIPDVQLSGDAVTTLGLLLGELQTNSLKYGSLSCSGGTITLRGRLFDDTLHLNWHEDCGRPVDEPDRNGSGFDLIKRVGSQGKHRGTIRWHTNGPSVDFYLKLASR